MAIRPCTRGACAARRQWRLLPAASSAPAAELQAREESLEGGAHLAVEEHRNPAKQVAANAEGRRDDPQRDQSLERTHLGPHAS